MKSKFMQLPITAFVVLPFRPMIDPLSATITCSGDTQPTKFELRYSEVLTISPSTHVLSAAAWTQVIIETHFLHAETDPEPDVVWFMSNRHGVEIVDHIVLPRLNEFLLRIKRASSNGFGTEVIRSVGGLDLVVVSLEFCGQPVFTRGTATMFTMMSSSTRLNRVIDPGDLLPPVPHEWATLVRATDLVNHGYFLEGFVVAFALLDASVQDFVKGLVEGKGFTPQAAKELMRSVESERLRKYLELLLPLVGVPSPLRDQKLREELKWLNTTRNNVMHAGRHCDLREAQRGLTAVLTVLRALNSCGATYVLPDALPFWSESK